MQSRRLEPLKKWLSTVARGGKCSLGTTSSPFRINHPSRLLSNTISTTTPHYLGSQHTIIMIVLDAIDRSGPGPQPPTSLPFDPFY